MSSSDDDEGLTSLDWPPSDLEPSDLSSDKFQETPHMKVGIFCKEGGQLKSGGLDASGGRPRQAALSRGGTYLCSIQHAIAATMQRQFTREFNISSSNKPSKKVPSVGSGNRGGRPGHLPQVTPWKKGPQEKSPGGAISKVVLGRKPQACLSGGPLALDSFPPILGLPVLGRTKYSLVPPGARQPKQNTGKPPGASRTRDSDWDGPRRWQPRQRACPKAPTILPIQTSWRIQHSGPGYQDLSSSRKFTAFGHGTGKCQAQSIPTFSFLEATSSVPRGNEAATTWSTQLPSMSCAGERN
ncbi:uncharacterized protein CXorf49 homolog isoform X4 [Bubalus bubalis]|uniref:uncharacterized protein CXorf49 homolog isoform X4 n=1 Tax=Bubalus bubalis TaxID=89462 RepID=UPI00042D0AE7|nr:uncharacterized protein CXorf49 homolog isoform X4 [Bubalus bubalis]